MRVPYSWLKAYVSIDLTAEALAERLTMSGLEVDAIEYPWPDIVTAEIVWLERIKGSDHLSATRVTTGAEELSVVCGASNIHLHDKVPLARVGAHVGDITIAPKRALGVLSEGMLCSPRELGISEDHSGIYILPPETPVGVPLGAILGEAVINLDIKAHRGDLFCMVGVAREVSAFTGAPLRPPAVSVREKGTPTARLMRLDVRDADLCPRYTARVVRGVRIGPSPDWMAHRLLAAGMRPINNVVDITNYVMLELGQPLHAFDYDKITDHSIIVRRAQSGEELTTLDGVTRRLTQDMLLITDPAGPVVIAGIFGGTRVEVSAGTTNVLLEAAHFNPANIRRTSQALGLRTESSGRFEKNPDIALTALAIDRAAGLMMELASGLIAPDRVDFYPTPVHERELRFAVEQVPWLTGMRVTRDEAAAALRGLGFTVQELAEDGMPGDAPTLLVRVPTWRGDVDESADLVEEIARIVGYDRIPSELPVGPLPAPLADTWFAREGQLRELLLGAGLTEVMTYPLTSRPVLARLLAGGLRGQEMRLGLPAGSAADAVTSDGASAGGGALSGAPAREPVLRRRADERRQVAALGEQLPAMSLHNPASSEMDTLRLTLMAGLLTVVRENSKHEDAGLWFFELGRRYLLAPGPHASSDMAQERRTLGVALSGPVVLDWDGPVRAADFHTVAGVADLLLRALHAADARYVPALHPTFHPGRCATLEVRLSAPASHEDVSQLTAARVPQPEWLPVGVLGEVHPEVAERFDVPQRTYLLELDLERLYAAVPAHVRFHAIPRYPTAQRDIAVVVPSAVPARALADAITGASPLVRRARLFDIYAGEGIPAEHKSMAYALTYQADDHTLTEPEIEAAHAAVLAALAARFNATLRA